MEIYDLIIIGAGLSGLMAAIEAKNQGMNRVIIIERECESGGAIGACVQDGFSFGDRKNITVPELITTLTDKALALGVIIKVKTTVLQIGDNNEVVTINSVNGLQRIKGKSILIATGSREKPYGYKNVLGYGAMAGINTSCSVMNYVNRQGALPGKKCIILGSDDIGMLTAKTLIMEGAEVLAIVETSDKMRSKNKESKEIIEDFNIPVLYKHRVVKILGHSRVAGVLIAELDDNFGIIEGTEIQYDCDTLVLCIQLRPDSELARKSGIKINEENQDIIIDSSYMTSREGIFACGTVTTGYDNYNNVMKAGREAAISIAKWRMSLDEG